MPQVLLDHLTEALVTLISAASVWLATWLRSDAQRRAALAAACAAELEAQRRPMSSEEKKALAVQHATARLPRGIAPRPEKLDALIERAIPEARKRTSDHPPEG